MMNGASTLEGFVPDVDATIVTRILDEGGTILGKATRILCSFSTAYTSSPAPVINPRKEGYSAGHCLQVQSMLANKEVDLAIGGDQGGSIRIPVLIAVFTV